MSIGKKLQKLLDSHGVNINELSVKLNIPRTTLYNMVKRDNTRADIDFLIQLATFFKVPVEYFGSKPLSLTEVYFHASFTEVQLIQKFRQLDEDDKRETFNFVNFKIDTSERIAKETGVTSA